MTIDELISYTPNHPERISCFEKEISLIQTPSVYYFAVYCLDHVPEYFFHVPASTSGCYHPSYALGEGGLVRHTKAAIGIAKSLIRAGVLDYNKDVASTTEELMMPREDIVLVALLLHDSYKCGQEDGASKTVFEHPNIAADALMENWGDTGNPLPDYWIRTIANCIHSHMGQWNTDKRSSTVLYKPNEHTYHAWLAEFVHICDYLASRRFLEYKFD